MPCLMFCFPLLYLWVKERHQKATYPFGEIARTPKLKHIVNARVSRSATLGEWGNF